MNHIPKIKRSLVKMCVYPQINEHNWVALLTLILWCDKNIEVKDNWFTKELIKIIKYDKE